MAIDDPFEKIREIADESDGELFASLVQASGVFSPIMAVLAIVKGANHLTTLQIVGGRSPNQEFT
jgi:hypothetical protein